MKKFFSLLLGLVVASNALAVTPADPTNVSWYDSEDEAGFSRLMYSLPQVDTEGNPLNLENLGYRVFTDNDQLFTFEASVYTFDDLYVDQNEIYYWIFSAGTDFHPTYTYFYRTNAAGYDQFFTWRIGIQAVYINDDNTKAYSNIVYTEVFDHPVDPEVLIGDVNGDNNVGIADVTALIDYLLGGGGTINVLAADVDQDGEVKIADVTTLIDNLLAGH
jgi:hypothetical protein